MKRILFLVCILNIALADVGKWGVEEDEHVAVLTKDNFDQFIKDNERVFVKFYAPWCGHCKAMAPGYSNLAKRMQTEENPIPIAKVDATIEKDLAEKFGIQGFPSLKYFVNGKPVDYQGGREENDIYQWLLKKTGPASVELTTEEQFDKHSAMSLSVLMILPEGDDALKTYMNLAMGYDEISFAHTSNEDLKKKLEIEQSYAFVVFRDFDEGRKVLSANTPPTVENLKEFFESVRFPMVMDFDQKSAERIFGTESPAMMYFTEDSTDSGLQLFRDFAATNQGRILFTYSTITTGLGARLAEFLGVTAEDQPAVRIVKFKEGQLEKFIVSDMTNEGFNTALDKFANEKLEVYYKSEAIPETNDEPVKVIVGNTFEELVVNNTEKYVLFEAYAPWCGHCKKLEPIYLELAEKLAGVEDLVIAKMDATANEHPSLNVTGFPTLKLYIPGMTNPTDYNGDRSLKDLVQFLETEMRREFETLKSEEL